MSALIETKSIEVKGIMRLDLKEEGIDTSDLGPPVSIVVEDIGCQHLIQHLASQYDGMIGSVYVSFSRLDSPDDNIAILTFEATIKQA